MGCGDVYLLRTIGGIDFTGQERAALNKLTMPLPLVSARLDVELQFVGQLIFETGASDEPRDSQFQPYPHGVTSLRGASARRSGQLD